MEQVAEVDVRETGVAPLPTWDCGMHAELVLMYVPEAEKMSFDDALALAECREAEAVEQLQLSIEAAGQDPPDFGPPPWADDPRQPGWEGVL